MRTEVDSALDGWKMQVSSVCWVGFRIGLTLRYHGYATSSAGSVQRISPVRSHREDRAVNDRAVVALVVIVSAPGSQQFAEPLDRQS